MKLKAGSITELASLLANRVAGTEQITSFDLSGLKRELEHKPEDMTATASSAMKLSEFQQQLASRGQWLPADPPNPENLTLGALLAENLSGPRRFGYGTIRDYVIGMQVMLPDGRLVHSGGKVVKNVAGYDLMKLFIGSRESLGVILEATFKVLPLPETEQFVQAKCGNLEEVDKLIEALLNSALTPVVLDLHNLSSSNHHLFVVLGFAGTNDDVAWQLQRATELGFVEPSSLDYQRTFFTQPASFNRISVLPSKTVEVIRALNNSPFVARAGNGIIYHSAPPHRTYQDRPVKLEQRLKNAFDPKHILPDLL
jgi:glycolate oxidase FAD binding subunit